MICLRVSNLKVLLKQPQTGQLSEFKKVCLPPITATCHPHLQIALLSQLPSILAISLSAKVETELSRIKNSVLAAWPELVGVSVLDRNELQMASAIDPSRHLVDRVASIGAHHELPANQFASIVNVAAGIVDLDL